MTDQLMTIREMCDTYEVTPRTLRFYEAKELIFPIREGQKRLFTRRDRARLKLILRGKKMGLRLDEMSEIESQRGEEQRRTDVDYEAPAVRGGSGGTTQATRGASNDRTDSGDETRHGGSSNGHAGGYENKQERAEDQGPMLDAADDDIVARQLREAAEQETNPALRKRLWQEYRDYKTSSSGGSQ